VMARGHGRVVRLRGSPPPGAPETDAATGALLPPPPTVALRELPGTFLVRCMHSAGREGRFDAETKALAVRIEEALPRGDGSQVGAGLAGFPLGALAETCESAPRERRSKRLSEGCDRAACGRAFEGFAGDAHCRSGGVAGTETGGSDTRAPRPTSVPSAPQVASCCFCERFSTSCVSNRSGTA